MGSHKTRDDEIYERGVLDGQEADLLDQVVHAQVKGWALTTDRRTNEIYNKGFDYEVAHRSQGGRADSSATCTEAVESSAHQSRDASVAGTPGSVFSESASDSDGMGLFVAPFYSIGAIWGLIAGFQAGGVLGAIPGFALGGAAGMLVGLLAMISLALGLMALVLYGIYWILSHLL